MESRKKLEALTEVVETLLAELEAQSGSVAQLEPASTAELLARLSLEPSSAPQPILTAHPDTKTKE